jgi:DNA-binding transcriptional regulator YhcF (GntR family)
MKGRQDIDPRPGKLPAALADLLGAAPSDFVARTLPGVGRAITVFSFGTQAFVCLVKPSSGSAVVLGAVEQLKTALEEAGRGAVPLVVVPYMGPAGQRICAKAGVSWFDLSGNADIRAPGLRIRVEGRPNLYKRRGRPSSVFAPRSARIVRWLLVHPEIRFSREQLSQRAFAEEARVDPGLASRVLGRLEESGYISRERSTGFIEVLDRDRLLDDWADEYDFRKHTIVEGHIATRSGEEQLRSLGEKLEKTGIDHATTGLGAGWLYTRFATFNLVTFYVSELPDEKRLAEMGFRETRLGANVWLVVPNDEGVMHNRGKGHGVFCVDPVQAYLDLRFHPERGMEMAPLLRRQIDIARRLREGAFLEDILDAYRHEGVSREMIDFVWAVVHNSRGVVDTSVTYYPPLRDWGEREA